ncbi:hypothetical protein CBS147333_2893 [Penicillium roqueforti]|nr:hypothetical protein CBS147333_2893 [Penicillium roqueforti]KAI3263352.1 hypothetical protein CBS147308_8763 [Penicillium roqueforti]KAI3295908.1 hypothetical protein DTO002I6_3591 [Penicillium roqueforti]KAI3297609.1 hypothetical protein DTO003C3_976 [Penicillium roqueforti]
MKTAIKTQFLPHYIDVPGQYKYIEDDFYNTKLAIRLVIGAGRKQPKPEKPEKPAKGQKREADDVPVDESSSPGKRLKGPPASMSGEEPMGSSEQATRGVLPRGKAVRDAALTRDGNACVLTKFGIHGLHVSHILPFKLNNSSREIEWSILEGFWGVDRVMKWKAEIMTIDDNDGKVDTERVQNLITFMALVHTYWDNTLYALRPISINTKKTSMEVAFHWLPAPGKITKKASDSIETMRHPFPHDINSFTESPGENICLIHGEMRSLIRSGHIFTLETDDPKSKPLPSMELLELQWIRHRIAAMRGAAEDDESEIDSDDDSVCVPSGS